MQCACDKFAVFMEASEVEVRSTTGGLCPWSMLRHRYVDQEAWPMFARQELDTSINARRRGSKNTNQPIEATSADKMHDAARHNTKQPFRIGPQVEKDYILLCRRWRGGGVARSEYASNFV